MFFYLCETNLKSMIKVTVKEKEDINRALKRFKKKFEKAQVIKEYRGNTFYTKKSVILREEKLKASYIQRTLNSLTFTIYNYRWKKPFTNI